MDSKWITVYWIVQRNMIIFTFLLLFSIKRNSAWLQPTRNLVKFLKKTEILFSEKYVHRPRPAVTVFDKSLKWKIFIYCRGLIASKGAFTLRLFSAWLMTVTGNFDCLLVVWDSRPTADRNFAVTVLSRGLKKPT